MTNFVFQRVHKLHISHITFTSSNTFDRRLYPQSTTMHLLFFILTVLAALISPSSSAPVDVPSLFTTLRHSTSSDLPSLLTAHPSSPSTTLLNMGFPSSTTLTTSSSRVILPAPRFHHLTYIIPHPSAPYSELLVANSATGKLENYGWISGHRWDASAPRRDLAIKLGEGRYLLADNVPVGGFGVTKAPWSEEIGGTKDGYRWLGRRWDADVVEKYHGVATSPHHA
ncbi:hypothetical protein PHSY_002813 [Pseudozyma hubeiensis SY62]|uniref:Uncharacterized protein n=1 Tax=Pseudozyma hubeiensis (strain SY62) TaxID=1305764 RepID=R9P1Q7_PSEHS|nr:hypothetical protein PHSY_002813 [Pseudozyma hubeiensis SY62]GAC95238.1 hypothetical protein PHSY_002813 [Pseudozyma hubeiensis SY62]